MEDPVFAQAHELAAAIRRREVSSSKVVDAHLAHIERHNPRLNAVATVDEEGARVRAADAALDGGEAWGPLHGVNNAARGRRSAGAPFSSLMGTTSFFARRSAAPTVRSV